MDHTDPEWDRAWGVIRRYFGGTRCSDPSGEAWQYMGTVAGVHQFRHRALPQHVWDDQGRARVVQTYRTYVDVFASPPARPFAPECVVRSQESNNIPAPIMDRTYDRDPRTWTLVQQEA